MTGTENRETKKQRPKHREREQQIKAQIQTDTETTGRYRDDRQKDTERDKMGKNGGSKPGS